MFLLYISHLYIEYFGHNNVWYWQNPEGVCEHCHDYGEHGQPPWSAVAQGMQQQNCRQAHLGRHRDDVGQAKDDLRTKSSVKIYICIWLSCQSKIRLTGRDPF